MISEDSEILVDLDDLTQQVLEGQAIKYKTVPSVPG